MKYNHVGIPTTANFAGEIPLPHLKVTVSDHQNNPFGIQWQRYWDDAPYPDLVKTVPHVAFEVDDLAEAIRDQKVIIAPNSPSTTSAEGVAVLLGGAQPGVMITDPPYGIELDSEWRDRAGLSGYGRAEPSYLRRTEGHQNTSISSDTRADWSEAFELVPSLEVAYVWHASTFTREVLDGLLRIGFEHHQQIVWNKGRAVLTRTHYWYQHEPCWYVRKKNAPWYGRAGENSTVWDSPSPKFLMGGSAEEKFDHPTQKPIALMQKAIENHTRRGGLIYDPFLGSGTTLMAAEVTGRVCYGLELDPKFVDVIVQRWQAAMGKKAVLEAGGLTFEDVQSRRI